MSTWWLLAIAFIVAGAVFGTAFLSTIAPENSPARELGVYAGFIVGAVSSLIAMGAVYAFVDIVRALVVVTGTRSEPEQPLTDGASIAPVIEPIADDLGRDPAQGSPIIGFIKLILFAVGLWVVYLLVKAILLP